MARGFRLLMAVRRAAREARFIKMKPWKGAGTARIGLC
jgi:hypothetical protein